MTTFSPLAGVEMAETTFPARWVAQTMSWSGCTAYERPGQVAGQYGLGRAWQRVLILMLKMISKTQPGLTMIMKVMMFPLPCKDTLQDWLR